MTALLRSASLTNFADVAASFALDAKALLAEVGLPSRCLHDPDLMIPAATVGRLLELAARRAREPAFGLRMAESRRLSNLGPLALLVRDEPTLHSALEAVVRHIHVHNEALALEVERSSNLVVIRQQLLGVGGPSLVQASELALGVMFRVIAVFMGAGWRPRLVCFAHGRPPSLAVHRRIFGDAVEFGHEFDGIVCNAADLDLPNPGADPVLARYAQRLLEPSLGANATLTQRVRQLVMLLLPRGLCRVEVVAQHLGMDRRTVHRRLLDEGTSFSAIVDALRCELAARYVEGTDRPLQDVAAHLGFAAPSAFSRWYAQRFGSSAAKRRGAAPEASSRAGHRGADR